MQCNLFSCYGRTQNVAWAPVNVTPRTLRSKPSSGWLLSPWPLGLNHQHFLIRNVSWEDLLMRRVPPPFVPTIVSETLTLSLEDEIICHPQLQLSFECVSNPIISRLVWRTCPTLTRSSPRRSQSWRLPRRRESWLPTSSCSSRTSPTWQTGARIGWC